MSKRSMAVVFVRGSSGEEPTFRASESTIVVQGAQLMENSSASDHDSTSDEFDQEFPFGYMEADQHVLNQAQLSGASSSLFAPETLAIEDSDATRVEANLEQLEGANWDDIVDVDTGHDFWV